MMILLLIISKVHSDLGISNYERVLLDIMKEDIESPSRSRSTRDVEGSGGGGVTEINCISTASQTCDENCVCVCNPGFYWVGPDCVKVRVFSGGLVVEGFVEEFEDVYHDYVKQIYSSMDGFREIRMTRRELSQTIPYELVFDKFVREGDIISTLDIQCEKPASRNFTLDCNKTISYTSDAIGRCGSTYADFCDVQTASCHVTNGEAYCRCLTDHYNQADHFTTCEKQTCTSNHDCSWPFGRCLTSQPQRSCSCFWGFNDANCSNPTIFILTSAIGLILLVAIFILLCCCCRQAKIDRENRKKHQTLNNLGTLADLSSSIDFQPGHMRARLPSHKPRHYPQQQSSTSTFSSPPPSIQSVVRAPSGSGLHHYTNQSFIDSNNAARPPAKRDVKRSDYF